MYVHVLIHTMQEEPKMAVSVSKRHNAGNCKTDLADLPSFIFTNILLFSAYYNEFAIYVLSYSSMKILLKITKM